MCTAEMTSKNSKRSEFHYEFGGPIGAFFIICGLPAVIYGLYFLCNKDFCLRFETSPNWDLFLSRLPTTYSDLVDDEGLAIFLGWMIFHFFLERILPGCIIFSVSPWLILAATGETAYGVLLEDKKRLPYVLSGHLQFWVTLFVAWHGIPEVVCKFPTIQASPL
jgi:hypothetical protein